MPGPGVAGDDPDAAAAAPRAARHDLAAPANRTMLRAISETAVAIRVRSVPENPASDGELAGAPGGRRRCRRRADRGSGPRRRAAGPRSSSGLAEPRAQVALQAGAEPRRPRAAGAGRRWTGRAAPAGSGSVGGSTSLQGQQVLDPQPRPGAVELGRHRAGGASPSSAASDRVSLAGDLVGEQRSVARVGELLERRRAIAARCSSGQQLLVRRLAVLGRLDARGAGCAAGGPAIATSTPPGCARSRSRTARACRARCGWRAASTLTRVSCTRSSAAGCCPTRARTIRRTIGISAATSRAASEWFGRAPSSFWGPHGGSLRRKHRWHASSRTHLIKIRSGQSRLGLLRLRMLTTRPELD